MVGSQTHAPHSHVLLRETSWHVAVHVARLQPQSSPLQPASHAHTLQLHQPLLLHVKPLMSTGHATVLTLQKAPAQPVSAAHSHWPHRHVPPLASHAASHGVVSQSQLVPFQPPSQMHVPQSHVPWPAQGWNKSPAGGQGENVSLQWAPL